MTTWQISQDGCTFERNGRPTFLLADTVWAAFNRPTCAEWRAHLQRRRMQGFNSVLISALPIVHDASAPYRSPFELNADGTPNLSRLDGDYWQQARRILEIANEEGITPLLVLLWCNYVPDTWGSERTPEYAMNLEQQDAYIDAVLDVCSGLEVMFAISGDDALSSPVALDRYRRAGQAARDRFPSALITAHPNPPAHMPESLAASNVIDFYGFQSGHGEDWLTAPRTLAEDYLAQPVRRPITNLEPCYEAHAFGDVSTRHTARNVRLASWQGILAGAGAGLGYGAHGVWSWHTKEAVFNGDGFSGRPFPASTANGFPGALDVGLIKTLVERHDLFRLTAADDLASAGRAPVMVGANTDRSRIALLLADPFDLTVQVDPDDYEVHCYSLVDGRSREADSRAAEGHLVLRQPEFVSDVLYVLERRA